MLIQTTARFVSPVAFFNKPRLSATAPARHALQVGESRARARACWSREENHFSTESRLEPRAMGLSFIGGRLAVDVARQASTGATKARTASDRSKVAPSENGLVSMFSGMSQMGSSKWKSSKPIKSEKQGTANCRMSALTSCGELIEVIGTFKHVGLGSIFSFTLLPGARTNGVRSQGAVQQTELEKLWRRISRALKPNGIC